jgi:hypothetical protein
MEGKGVDEGLGVLTVDGARGGENSNDAAGGPFGGGLDGRHGANEGNGEGPPQPGERQSACGIAGHHHNIRSAGGNEPRHHRHNALHQHRLVPVAVGEGRDIGGIKVVRLR